MGRIRTREERTAKYVSFLAFVFGVSFRFLIFANIFYLSVVLRSTKGNKKEHTTNREDMKEKGRAKKKRKEKKHHRQKNSHVN